MPYASELRLALSSNLLEYRSDVSVVQRLSLPHLTRLALQWDGCRWDCSPAVQLWPQLRDLSLSHSQLLENEGEPA